MLTGNSPEDQSVAIVGAACRLPGGVSGLDQLWQALVQRRDLVGEAPDGRFDPARFVDASGLRPGKSYTSAGGYLDDVESFDAGYFGISPKEAARMDPQQRLLLELAVEALDDAGIAAESLAGSDTAVHIGMSDNSYGALQATSLDSTTAYTMTGAAASITANRLSHSLDLRGPSWAVDTACSSSLVAVDQACRTLLAGTSRTVLCGGVNLLLSPFPYVGFSQASMLSPRGRCAAFSAEADGFARAEGGGLVVLKRLADALADGDRVHAVIVGSGTNSDGRTNGLALPNPEAQRDLLRSVYERAGVHPDELVYVEAHGTGTQVGDPAECTALGEALGGPRTVGALPIGSVKTNTGHLEPASGIVGLLKALLVLRHRTIPASLHAEPPNPDIDFTGLGLAVATEPGLIPAVGRAVIGVNSFGFGGTNAHVVLSAPTRSEPGDRPVGGPRPVLVSAHTPAALTRAAADLAARLLEATGPEFYDIARTSCLRRGRREHRRVVLAADPAEAARLLTADTSPGQPPAPCASGVGVRQGRVAFVFCGNGAQWAGMGVDLLAADPVFRAAFAEVDAMLAPHLGWSVARRLGTCVQPDLAATEVAQPLLFAVQVGVVAVLRERGIVPSMVLGHSVGEVAAAWTAGALSLAQAARVIAERSKAQALTAGSGRMAAVALTQDEARDVLADYPDVELAGVNGPRGVTVAGPGHQVEKLVEELTRRDVHATALDLDYAFHSAAMDPVRDGLCAALADLEPGGTTIPLISTVTGRSVDGTELDAEYWWRNVRTEVRFEPAVEQAIAEGADVLIEIGPRPLLRGYLRDIAAAHPQTPIAVVPTLRRDADGAAALSEAVASVIAVGGHVDWDRYFPVPGRIAELPAYPWQRERHWNGTPQDWTRTSGNGRIEHPLLGERMPAPHPVWDGAVEPVLVPWVGDHVLAGSVVMPATAYVEMALAAGELTLGRDVEIQRLEISRPLVVPWPHASDVRTQTSYDPDGGAFRITSTHETGAERRPHVRGRVRQRTGPVPDPVDVIGLRAGMTLRHTADQLYCSIERHGLAYGPDFRVLDEVWVGDREVLAGYRHTAPTGEFTIHPALLDGALQAGFTLLRDLAQGYSYLPSSFGRIRVWQPATPTGFMRVRDRTLIPGHPCWDITVLAEDGAVVAELTGCRLRRMAWTTDNGLSRVHTVLRAAPHPDGSAAPSPLPTSRELMTAAHDRVAQLCRDVGPGLRRLHELSRAAFGHDWAETLSALLPPGTREFGEADLFAAGVLEKYAGHVELATSASQAEGLVEPVGPGRWRFTGVRPDLGAVYRRLVDEVPGGVVDHLPALTMCRNQIPVLRGERDPLDVLAADGNEHLLVQSFDLGLTSRFYDLIVQEVLRQVLRRWPADRPLRVLEVGAGTGGLSSALLPLLPAERAHYVYTDISPYFLTRAEKRFARYDFVQYRALDLDADPRDQGFTAGAFDLVVAANALHTAKDLEAALDHVATVLAPGGRLVAFESHSDVLLAPTFGLMDSFRAATDRHLRSGMLLPHEQWPPLLRRRGFTDIAQTGAEDDPVPPEFSVIVATAPDRHVDRPALPAGDRATSWVLLTESAEETALAEHTAHLLRDAGCPDIRIVPASRWTPPCDVRDMAVVLILARPDGDDPGVLLDRTTRCAAVLRTLARAQRGLSLWVVTRPSGAVPTPDAIQSSADAAVWGLARSLGNEYPVLAVRRISLHRDGRVGHEADRLVRELLALGAEDEIVLTEQGRFVPREVELADTVADAPAYELEIRSPGLSYELAWRAKPVPTPGNGQAVVEVHAVALNYRDVMLATGLVPAEAFESTGTHRCGLECAGVVTAVGPDVTGLAVGDEVFGLVPGAFTSHVLARADALVPVPESMTFTEAATLPVVFSTVHYSLGHLARLTADDTVLVHGGAGGVGLAVLQYARLHGAAVIATAGTETKRAMLRALGVEHVVDSRSLEFADEVMRLTDGRGVDVVVNSLAGEAIARSLELLRPGGRFVELGKRDILADAELPLNPFRNDLAFFGVDVTALTTRPKQMAALTAEVAEQVHDGAYRPLPHCVYPAGRVDEAFRLMQHSRHVGKVVVSFEPGAEPVTVRGNPEPPALDPESTYLVTGGLGGFGAATACRLAERGARHLALVSRRGADAPEAEAVLKAIAERGARAVPYAADAADPDAMRRVIADIDASGHPLRGIVHCAMHLDDAPLGDLTDERIRAVLSPKLGGALVLDRLTREHDLDLFLLYSSAATLVGNARQSPYVAGNLFLEALARQRRQAGLPATAIAWGAIGDVGYVARNNLDQALTLIGLDLIPVGEALAAGEDVMGHDEVVTAVGRYRWARLRMVLPGVRSPRCSALASSDGEGSDGAAEPLARQLAGMSANEALDTIATVVTGMVAEVLQLDPEQIDRHRRVDTYGMDSLMSAELFMAIRKRFDVDVSPMELLHSEGTVAGFTEVLHLRLGLATAQASS
jgi:acyl transferase domain-containing protein/NADPH:quinone reductase-like Zn-dependent oxidoreductase/SAM-dependent methyltransferase/acyl carrier protein/NADP-dependent 3-hydroxy acid dehydrogenase YdfG